MLQEQTGLKMEVRHHLFFVQKSSYYVYSTFVGGFLFELINIFLFSRVVYFPIAPLCIQLLIISFYGDGIWNRNVHFSNCTDFPKSTSLSNGFHFTSTVSQEMLISFCRLNQVLLLFQAAYRHSF